MKCGIVIWWLVKVREYVNKIVQYLKIKTK